MAEPTLAQSYTDLQADVGYLLGWGRGAARGDLAFSARQQATIDDCIKSGLRQFYYPPPLPGERTSYDWSFLKPTASLQLRPGLQVIPLPDDYGGFDGQVVIVPTGNTCQPWPIEWENEGRLRQRYACSPGLVAPPRYVAIQWLKGTTSQAGQRAQLYFFPTADKLYTVTVPYYVNPDCLSATAPYAYGGAQHAETITESCLAIAEERVDDDRSVHAAKFLERLAASVAMDRKNKPQRIGYNGDRSDRANGRFGWWHWDAPTCTYNGSSFD